MQVFVNGEAREFSNPLSVAELLAHLQVPRDKVAVEHNLEIVPKSTYDTVRLAEGDRIEIVQFIGGGA